MMKKKHLLITLLSIALLTLSGCQAVENWFKNAKEEWLGLEMTVRTYDENSQLIDQMSGKSLSISRNEEFDSVDEEGNSKEDSSVLKITLGKYEIDHVGSSLIVTSVTHVSVLGRVFMFTISDALQLLL